MNAVIHFLTGVPRPGVSPEELGDLASLYDTVARSALASRQETRVAIDNVLTSNSGTATAMFEQSTISHTSSLSQLDAVADAASRTRDAHTDTASTIVQLLVQMDAITNLAARELANPPTPRPPLVAPTMAALHAFRVISEARRRLQVASTAANERIIGIYGGLHLPEVPSEDPPTYYGTASPEIQELWDGMSNEERVAVVEALYAKETEGMDNPPDLIFYSNDKENRPEGARDTPPKKGDASGFANRKNEVWVNWDHIEVTSGVMQGIPFPLHVVVHELQHQQQFRMIKKYDNLVSSDPDLLEDVRAGRSPDPFVQHGSTIEEVERLKTPYPGSDLPPEEWTLYSHHPLETSARRAGTEWLDDLTLEEFEELANT